MRLPPRDRKAERLYDEYGLCLESRLQADARCRDLAERWSAAQERLRAAIDAHTEARVAGMRACAARDVADAALDQEVRMFHRTIAVLVHNNSRAGLMQIYFPDGSPAVTRALPRTELSLVEILLSLLEPETEPRLCAHREPLREALAAFRVAVTEHERALRATRDAGVLEQMARTEWFTDYEALYHELRARFVREPGKVERFFRSYQSGPAPVAERNPGAGEVAV